MTQGADDFVKAVEATGATTFWPLDRKMSGLLGMALETLTTLVRRSFLPSAVCTRCKWEGLVADDMLEGVTEGPKFPVAGMMEGMVPKLVAELPCFTTFSIMGVVEFWGKDLSFFFFLDDERGTRVSFPLFIFPAGNSNGKFILFSCVLLAGKRDGISEFPSVVLSSS